MAFSFALEYVIRRIQLNQDGLKLNGAHQLLFYAHGVNISGGSIHAVKKKKHVLLVAIKEIGLEVNAGKLSTWSCL